MVILLWILFLPVGIVLAILLMFVLLPIRTGASGYYNEEGAGGHGWVRAFAGLLGVVIDYGNGGKHFCVMFGPWVIWRPKGDKTTDKQDVAPESDLSVFPPVQQIQPEPATALPPVFDQSNIEPVTGQQIERATQVEYEQKPVEQTTILESPELIEDASQKRPGVEPQSPKLSLWGRWRKLKVQITRYRAYWNDVQPIVWRFVKRLFHIIRFRRLEMDVTIGTGDPALTGKLFGYVQAVRPLLGKHFRFDMRPDFTRERAEVTGALELSVYVYRILWAVSCLLIRGGWAGWRIWRIEKKAQQVMTPSEV